MTEEVRRCQSINRMLLLSVERDHLAQRRKPTRVNDVYLYDDIEILYTRPNTEKEEMVKFCCRKRVNKL